DAGGCVDGRRLPAVVQLPPRRCHRATRPRPAGTGRDGRPEPPRVPVRHPYRCRGSRIVAPRRRGWRRVGVREVRVRAAGRAQVQHRVLSARGPARPDTRGPPGADHRAAEQVRLPRRGSLTHPPRVRLVARAPDGAGMLNPRIGALVALALGASVLTGCGGHSGGGPVTGDRAGAAASSIPPAPRIYPPRRFAGAAAVIDGAPLAVVDGVGYHYTDNGLAAADLATGRRRWQVTLPGAQRLVSRPMAHDDPPVPGVVTDAQGQALLVAAYFESVTGTGTQQDTNRTTVVAVDLSGRTRWTAALPADLLPQVVGGIRDDRGAAVVLHVAGTAVLDAGSGAVRWTARDVYPSAVDGTTVVGVRRPGGHYDPWPSVGLRSTDGTALWTGPA